jgi:hypothetical protein
MNVLWRRFDGSTGYIGRSFALGEILTAIGVMRDKTGAFEVVLPR